MFFDFDGTLAAIGDDPAAVCPVDGATAMLAQLAATIDRVAIVSARPVAFLREHFTNIDLYGLYGLESHRGGRYHEHPEAARWRPVVDLLVAEARADLGADQVEAKGLSLALHYRRSPERAASIQQWARTQANRWGLRYQPGRMVAELKPPIAYDKGDVVAAALGAAQYGWFCGDDVADLRGFHALTGHAIADPDFTPVRVAVANNETAALADAADLVIASPAALVAYLNETIATRCR